MSEHCETKQTKAAPAAAFRWYLLGALACGLALVGADSAGAQGSHWQLELAATTAQATPGFGFDSNLGWSAGLDYRLSPRFGVGVSALGSHFKDDFTIDIFSAELSAKQSYRATWLLSRLDLHLNPEGRADVVIGPVFGKLETSDISTEVRVRIPEDSSIVHKDRVGASGGAAWGAHLRVDIRLGEGRSYLTTGATYVRGHVDVVQRPEGGPLSFDLEPLVVHLGYAVRF